MSPGPDPARNPLFFRRSEGDLVYWLDTAWASAGLGLEGFSAGVAVFPDAQQRKDLGASLTLAEARVMAPVFFFAAESPTSDIGLFADNLAKLGDPADIRITWLRNPNAEPAAWEGSLVEIRDGAVAKPVAIRFGDLRLSLPAGAKLAWMDDAATFAAARSCALGWHDGVRPDEVALAELTLRFDRDSVGLLDTSRVVTGSALASLGLGLRRRLGERTLAFPIFDAEAPFTAEVRLDPLNSFDPQRSSIGLSPKGGGKSVASAFRCEPWPTRVMLTGGALERAVFTTAGGLGLDGHYELSAEGGREGQEISLVCGLDTREQLKLKPSASFYFAPSAERGSVVYIESAEATYGADERGRDSAQRWSKLWDFIPDYPIVPYAMTREPFDACKALEAEVLVPARAECAAAANPPTPPPPDPGVELPPVTIAVVEPPRATMRIPRGWTLPGTVSEDAIGGSAVFTDEARGVRLELTGLPQALVRAIAFPPEGEPLIIVEGEAALANAACTLTAGSDTIKLDPRTWAGRGSCLVIRAASKGALKPGQTSLAWPASNAADAKPLLLFLGAAMAEARRAAPEAAGVLDAICGEGGEGVALINIDGPYPERVGKALGGLPQQLAEDAPVAWIFAAATAPAVRSCLVASSEPELQSDPLATSVASLRSAAVCWSDAREWTIALSLRLEAFLGHVFPDTADGAANQLLLRATVGANERLQVASVCTLPPGPLKSVEFGSARQVALAPVTAEAEEKTAPEWLARIQVGGLMKFSVLPVDILSFGGEGALPFDGLAVEFRAVGGALTLKLDDTALTVDGVRATARANSLYKGLPLAPPAFMRDRDGKPFGALGLVGIGSPAATGSPGPGWCALRHTVELGALGQIGAQAGLTADLVIAWHPGDGAVAMGLSLPGSDATSREFGLSDLAKLKFRAVTLVANLAETPPRFALRLEDMKLSLLRLVDIPPGRTDLMLFGKPGDSGARPFGWFAAYAKEG